jgi:hypothetical protein
MNISFLLAYCFLNKKIKSIKINFHKNHNHLNQGGKKYLFNQNSFFFLYKFYILDFYIIIQKVINARLACLVFFFKKNIALLISLIKQMMYHLPELF